MRDGKFSTSKCSVKIYQTRTASEEDQAFFWNGWLCGLGQVI